MPADPPNQPREPSVPHVVIPYFSGDTGARPLPGVSYLCPALHIDGNPYGGTPIASGSELSLSAQVVNYGRSSAAEIAFFWADLNTTTDKSVFHLIGICSVYLAWNLAIETPAVPWTMPPSLTGHVCLLAQVSALGDEPTHLFDPGLDRHIAQHNLCVINRAATDAPPPSFDVSNPFDSPTWFELTSRVPSAEVLTQMADILNIDAGNLKGGVALLSTDMTSSPDSGSIEQVRLQLQPGETIRCRAEFPASAASDAVIATIIEQHGIDDHGWRQFVGGLCWIEAVAADQPPV